MGTFDFLSGMQGQSGAYSQFQPTADYSQMLQGGQAQASATQGLDFSKIGDWATQMAQKTQWAQNPQSANFQGVLSGGNTTQGQVPDMQKMLQAMGATQGTQPTQGTVSPLQAHARQLQLGQVVQGNAGYIGGNTRSGLLGSVR